MTIFDLHAEIDYREITRDVCDRTTFDPMCDSCSGEGDTGLGRELACTSEQS